MLALRLRPGSTVRLRGRRAGVDRVAGRVVHLLAVAHVRALGGGAVRVDLDLTAVVGSAVLLPALVPPADRGSIAVVLGSAHVHMQDGAGWLGHGGQGMPDHRGGGRGDPTPVVTGERGDRCKRSRDRRRQGDQANDDARARPRSGTALRAARPGCPAAAPRRVRPPPGRSRARAGRRCGRVRSGRRFDGGRRRRHGAISLATDWCWARGSAGPPRSSSRRRRRLARCRRTRNAVGDWPSTVAASAGRRPSQAISVIASRSFAGSRASAAATRPVGSSGANAAGRRQRRMFQAQAKRTSSSRSPLLGGDDVSGHGQKPRQRIGRAPRRVAAMRPGTCLRRRRRPCRRSRDVARMPPPPGGDGENSSNRSAA